MTFFPFPACPVAAVLCLITGLFSPPANAQSKTVAAVEEAAETPAQRYALNWRSTVASAQAFINTHTPLANASSYWTLDSVESRLWYKPLGDGDSIHWARLAFVFKTLPEPAHTLEFPFSLPFVGDTVALAELAFDNELERMQLYLSQAAKAVKAVQKGRLLTPEQALAVAQNAYPDTDWGWPELDRDPYPPYPLRWEVLENHCNPCREVYVAMDRKVLLEGGK